MAVKRWIWKETAEVLGVIGVIAGIIFLIAELRQNNELLQSQTLFNHTQVRLAVGSPLHDNQRLAEIISKKNEGKTLTSVEERMLFDWYNANFVAWEWEFREFQRGMLDEIPVEAFRTSLTGDFVSGGKINPGQLEYWAFAKVFYSDNFVEWMDETVIGGE